MKRSARVLFYFFAVVAVFSPLAAGPLHACGHEGWYLGAGYSQLLQYSPDNQPTAVGVPSPGKTNFRTRWGFYGKGGYDFCNSRWGIELPVSYNRQRLNRLEMVNVIGLDLNAVFHIIETEGGFDFYWIGGSGMNILTEGTVQNNTGAAGVNINFGPGIQYFFDSSKKVAFNFSVPLKYTLYFQRGFQAGSGPSKNISVLGIPFQLGFTVGL